jgi:hypothetical protein
VGSLLYFPVGRHDLFDEALCLGLVHQFNSCSALQLFRDSARSRPGGVRFESGAPINWTP